VNPEYPELNDKTQTQKAVSSQGEKSAHLPLVTKLDPANVSAAICALVYTFLPLTNI
jgi:hypothetical protein